jgi:hypothetical protein
MSARSETTSISGTSRLSVRRKMLAIERNILDHADSQGWDLSPLWDGTTPPIVLGGAPVGWSEATDLLIAAADWAKDEGAHQIAHELHINLAAVTRDAILVEAIAKETIDTTGRRLHTRLIGITRFVRFLAASMRYEWDIVSASLRPSVAPLDMHHPSYLARMYNRCFLDAITREFILDTNARIAKYLFHFQRWALNNPAINDLSKK